MYKLYTFQLNSSIMTLWVGNKETRKLFHDTFGWNFRVTWMLNWQYHYYLKKPKCLNFLKQSNCRNCHRRHSDWRVKKEQTNSERKKELYQTFIICFFRRTNLE